MVAFLDFESSGLDERQSYPIEVGWAFSRGASRSLLILPHPDWQYWDPGAQAVHGISRAELAASGVPGPEVARRLNGELGGQTVLCSAPDDVRWMDLLFAAAGVVRRFAVHEIGREIERAAAERHVDLAAARAEIQRRFPYAHRAGPDAEYLRALWRAVGSPAPRPPAPPPAPFRP